VLEAAFSFCHNENRRLVYFGENKTAANEILQRRLWGFPKPNWRAGSQV